MLGWHVIPAGQPGDSSVGSQTTASPPAHVVLQETLGRPVVLDAQHCDECPNDAVHCEESLHDSNVLGGPHDCELAWQVELCPRMATQHPTPTGQRIEPQATVTMTADPESSPEESWAALES